MRKANTTLAAILALSTGCATVFHGTTEDVNVVCESPRAQLRADGERIAAGDVALRRRKKHELTAEEPGLERTRAKTTRHISIGYAILDGIVSFVFFPIGLIAPIVDIADGAIFNLKPEHVVLPAPTEPVTEATPAPAPAPQ